MADDLKDALTRMQERFPAPWKVDVFGGEDGENWWAVAHILRSDDTLIIEANGVGPTPHAAVDAAIKAHDDMVKADALFVPLKAECEAWRAWDEHLECDEPRPIRDAITLPAAVQATRAATDRAGALR